jgi:hypothetical protein
MLVGKDWGCLTIATPLILLLATKSLYTCFLFGSNDHFPALPRLYNALTNASGNALL